jgi:hypothetical protein
MKSASDSGDRWWQRYTGHVDPEIDREFQAIFDAHDEAIRGLRDANMAMGHAVHGQGNVIDGIREANDAMGAAIQAHDVAIQAALLANRRAMALLRRLSNDTT